MEDVRNKYVLPTISETAFNCPHCGALAKQIWYSAHADSLDKDQTPLVIDAERAKEARLDDIRDPHEREEAKRWVERMMTGRPFLKPEIANRRYDVQNLSISKCYNCNDISVWIYDGLVWPRRGEGPLANPDLPKGAREDYDEASSILDLSPRGAAALLRLAIQKLCKHLGQPGKNINDDIAALVRSGLDPRVQQALDVVRVIGNNAVHPGRIDLKDDRATAEKLFGLVNLIAEIMIGQPKHVEAMYDSLPETAREAIEKRDGKK